MTYFVGKINITNLVELIFSQVTDGKTMCRLAQVSTKFNKVIKQKLITKEKNESYKTIWTELPNGLKHGLYKEWYENGQIHIKNNYLNDKKHGTSKVWFKNGQIYIRNNYLNDKKHGVCKDWYKNGQIKVNVNYLNGIRHGKCERWFENEELIKDDGWEDLRGVALCIGLPKNEYSRFKRNFIHGKRNGTDTAWYSTGGQLYIKNYLDDKKHGEYKWWNQAGQLVIDENYVNDELVTGL